MEPSIYKMTPQFSSLSRKTLILFLIEKPKHDWLFLSLSLVLYLHIIAGLSRKEANSTLITLKTILGSFIEGNENVLPNCFPINILTALSLLQIEPTIHRALCCPKCFLLYPHPHSGTTCLHKETARSRACQSSLYDKNGQPTRLYSTQNFHSWIKSFLQREGVEELLQKSVDYSNSTPSTLRSVWDGNIWNSFKDSDGNVFTKQIGIYLDWFNPLGNKIAGKHKSVGVILLFCLSLPATHCYQLQKIFFAGITPEPSKPTVLQINNVIAPLVSELRLFWQPGVVIPTFKHPEGLIIKAAVISAVCDLPAIRKLIGYASHSAKFFCSFCYPPQAEITSLYYGSWPPQSFQGHQAESQEWKNATTHAERKALLESTGVRWSVLNELPYWNPTDYVVVKPMHCLSGMLEWHCRKLWGLDVIAADISDSKKLVQVGYPVTEDYFDEDEWEENLEQAQNEPTGPSINLESLQEALMDIDEEMQLENNDYGPPVFSEYDLLIIWKVIRLTKLPTWLNCLSLTFGDASAEKV
ncbi:hypothetical protein MJO28_014641 [Puccinia striiformis f. sp. tritici]|uniref:Uncharacterized protein n=1 Tax=Puccinia striiformis f. sp. tritici TaxID=168172 RepID=A0ACC0DUI2_9BASI|nr:hypothetical protein MJO28_014641 [Puccinia striiformis f. sp. tritici]